MRRMALLALSTASFLALALSAHVGLSRLASAPTLEEPPAELQPGREMPPDSECMWPSYVYTTYSLGCSLRRLERLYWFSFDAHEKHIVSLSMSAHISAGDLIRAWGEPTGASYGWMIVLYWQGRSAIFFPHDRFSPESLTRWIDFSSRTYKVNPWLGFRNKP